ncbi:RTA1 like protein [Trametes elegans]|nr:RTA1 like protein [Trametes elegans]
MRPAVLHLTQAIRARAWWLFPTVILAGVGEIVGWGCRAWSFYQPLEKAPYMAQIVTLIISPTPLIGALFITFGRMSARLGQQYGRISSGLYSKIFLSADIFALVVQSAGGGIAATSDDKDTSRMGSNIMLAGVIFQLVSLSFFCVLFAEFMFRRIKDKPLKRVTGNGSSDDMTVFGKPLERPMMLLAIGLCIETVLLYIRAVYRTIELADGWDGKVIQTEYLFIVFDGTMVFLTMATLNVFHPGRLLNMEAIMGSIPLSSKVSV